MQNFREIDIEDIRYIKKYRRNLSVQWFWKELVLFSFFYLRFLVYLDIFYIDLYMLKYLYCNLNFID